MQANNGAGPILASTPELSHGIMGNGRHFLTQVGNLAGRAVQVVYHHVPLSPVTILVNGLFFCVANAITNRVNKKWITDRIQQKNEPFNPKETLCKNVVLDGCVAIVVVLGEMAVTKMLRQKELHSQRSLVITFIAILVIRHFSHPNDEIIELVASEAKGKLTQPPPPPSSLTDSEITSFLSLLIERNSNAESSISSTPKKPAHHLSGYASSEEEEGMTEEDSESNVSNDQDDDTSFINSEIGRLEDYLPADESLAQSYIGWFLENKEERLQFLKRMILKTQQSKSLPHQCSEMAFDIRKLILVAQSYNPDLKPELEKLLKPSEQLTHLYEELQKIEAPAQPESASFG
jgi:hypothetical protein